MYSLQLQQTQNMHAYRPLLKLMTASSSAWRSIGTNRSLQPLTAAASCHRAPLASSLFSTLKGSSLQHQQHILGLQQQQPLQYLHGVRTVTASAGAADTDPQLKTAIQEAEQASQASETTAPRLMNPAPSHPGDVLPETTLLEGEDHTGAFAAADATAEQAATEHFNAVRQGANVGAIADEQPGVSEPGNGAVSEASSESDAEDLQGDPKQDAESAMYLDEADLPLKGAPPMDRLSDPTVIDTWLQQRRYGMSLSMHFPQLLL